MNSRLPTSSASHRKIIFADQLRAIAVLSVMIVHLLGSYWLARDTVAAHIAAPVLDGPSARSLDIISFKFFNFGPFGVALFFLISGFVIPFSVARASRWRFFGARLLRIYPTYMACLAIGMAMVWLSSHYWNMPLPWDTQKVFFNATLLQSIAAVDSMDMVNWSLAVEIKFYLLACLAAGWINRGRALFLVLLALLIAVLIYIQASILPDAWQRIPMPFMKLNLPLLSHDLMFIPFMLIGTLYTFHYRGQLSARILTAGTTALMAVFLFAWRHTVLEPFFPHVPLNYIYALGVFTLAYVFRRHFRPNRLLDGLAALSYPLYALHTLVGYVSIRLLMQSGVTYYLALVVTGAILLAMAAAVHWLAELPTQRAGQWLMRPSARQA